MPQPKLATLRLGGTYADIELSYVDWGPADAEQVVFCVHGLTRNARDFDTLAKALAEHAVRVIAVDMVGRGHSTWLSNPEDYLVPNYAAHISLFLSQLKLPRIDWIGTSMGGIIGIALAAQECSPINRLILNDIGPFIAEAALMQIQTYLGVDQRFTNIEGVETHLRTIHAGFGPLSNAQWHHLAFHSARETSDGWRLSYDPAIRVSSRKLATGDIEMWQLWDKIRCPTYVLHGEESNVLLRKTVDEMQARGPKATVAHVQGVGHAPALMSHEQILTVERWLGLNGS